MAHSLRTLRSALATLAVVAAGLLLALAAEARPPHHGPGFLEHHAEQLGLEPAQSEAIAALIQRSETESEPLRQEVRDLRGQLHEMLMGETPDVAAVMAHADALGAAETELHKLRLSTMMGIHATLTPEQREQLRELRGELRGFAGKGLDEACSADVANLCPDAEDPLARAHCLRQNRDGLSEECADALRCARRKHFKGGPGGFHGRWHGPPEGPPPVE